MLFIENPGARERQLKRKHENSELFNLPADSVSAEQIVLARQLDSEEVEAFMHDFQKAVERAVNLKPNEDSEIILKLKEELDMHYQHCCSLQGDMTKIKTALKTLIQAIMNAVRAAAGNDVVAQGKLDEEEQARDEHFRLQELAFIADITREESSIPGDELGLSLLSEPLNVISEALTLFSAEQLSAIVSDIHQKFSELPDDTIEPYQEKLNAIAHRLTELADLQTKN